MTSVIARTVGRVMIGTQIGSYRVVRQIGEGGMGQVYLAEHTLIGRQAAIKVLLPQLSHREEIVNRFFNEARAATAIKHPGIVEVYDFGYHTDGSAFIVMEHLSGESLDARRLRLGTLPIMSAVDVIAQMANALAAAHAQGIVHRDLKPENVFLVPDPVSGSERTKILDFGIAKLVSNDGPGSQTGTGVIMGTPSYMAPEQCRGAGKVDHRADLYSLGCMLFELVCGRPPFDGEGAGEVLAAHLHVAAPRAGDLAPTLPAEVDAIIARLLAKNPAQRYQSANELLEELRAVMAGPAGARTATDPTFHAGQPTPASVPPGTLLAPGSVPPGEQTAAAGSYPPPMSGRPGTPWNHPPTLPLGMDAGAAAAADGERVTTLGAAAGALTTRPRRNSGSIVAAVVAVAAIAGGAFAFTRGGGADSEGSSSVVAANPVPATPPVESTPPIDKPIDEPDEKPVPLVAPPSAASDATITISLQSEPPGAIIYRQPDGIRLGTTPRELTRQASEGELELLLVLKGHKRRSILVPADQNSIRVVRLERVKRSSGKKPGGTKPIDKKAGDKKPGDKKPDGKKPDSSDTPADRTVDPFSKY